MSGLFEGLDLANAADDPFLVPDGVYNAVVSEVRVGETKDGTKKGMTTIFTILDEEQAGKTVSRWLLIPDVQDPKNPTADEARALSFLKSHLISLGIAPEEVGTVETDDLIGTEVTVAIQNKNGYTNVRKIQPTVASNELPF